MSTKPINSEVIETLEDVLEFARNGRLTGVVLVCPTVTGSVMTAFVSTAANSHAMLAGLATVQHELVQSLLGHTKKYAGEKEKSINIVELRPHPVDSRDV